MTEGAYNEDTDTSELNNEDWKFEEESSNNIQLPTKIRKDLKNSIIKRIKVAKEKYFKDPKKLSILDDDDQKFIR